MPTLETDKKIDTSFATAASNAQIAAAKNALQAKGFKVLEVDNLAEAKQAVLKMIPKGQEVFTATSATLEKAGLADELNSDKYVSVRDKFMPLYGQKDKQVQMRRIGSGADYAVGSVHAITEDGQAVVASATGSQIPNYVYGASNVIWVVGSQKIVKDLEQAFERIENYTYFLEDQRAKKAYGRGSSINKILIYRKDPASRVTVVLVKEPVGF